jgi:hypothetical protein
LIIGAIACVTGVQAPAQQMMDGQQVVERTVLTKVGGDAPVRGYRISPEDIKADGHNFEYCSGGTAQVDLSQFKSIGEKCKTIGWMAKLDDAKTKLAGATVYTQIAQTNEYTEVGKVIPTENLSHGALSIDFLPGKSKSSLKELSIGTKGIDIVRSHSGNFSVILDSELVNGVQQGGM